MGTVIQLRRKQVPESKMLVRRTGNISIEGINALTTDDRIWMAGFFDGEGSIGLYRKMKDGAFYSVTVRITITQTDRTALDMFFGAFGGALVLIDRPDRGTTRHTQYWSWTCDAVVNASVFLQTIRKYMRAKAAEADVLLEYLNNRDTYSMAQKGELVDRLSQLKTRRATHMEVA